MFKLLVITITVEGVDSTIVEFNDAVQVEKAIAQLASFCRTQNHIDINFIKLF